MVIKSDKASRANFAGLKSKKKTKTKAKLQRQKTKNRKNCIIQVVLAPWRNRQKPLGFTQNRNKNKNKYLIIIIK